MDFDEIEPGEEPWTEFARKVRCWWMEGQLDEFASVELPEPYKEVRSALAEELAERSGVSIEVAEVAVVVRIVLRHLRKKQKWN